MFASTRPLAGSCSQRYRYRAGTRQKRGGVTTGGPIHDRPYPLTRPIPGLGWAGLGWPCRSRTGSSGLVPSLASAFDWLDARRRSSSLGGLEHLPPGTALARFRTALPGGPTDPGAAGRQLAGALLAGWAPCLWAGGGKVLESCTLETLGPGARVLYQLLRGPGGGLADACFVSAHRHAASGGELVGQWSVEHPACPPPQRGVRRCTGLVAFLIHPEVTTPSPSPSQPRTRPGAQSTRHPPPSARIKAPDDSTSLHRRGTGGGRGGSWKGQYTL